MNSTHSILRAFLYLAILALLLATIFWVDLHLRKNEPQEIIIERVDTLLIHDTVVSTVPKYVSKRVVDSIYVPVKEVIVERDTIRVLLEREQVIWEDSLARVYASGIPPQVDSIHHYRDKMIITKETIIKTSSRWGVGIQGGVGAGKGGLTPYIGVGISYNLLTF